LAPASYATIHRMIDNPIYGGGYAYGKSRVASGYDGAAARPRSRRKARADWLALIPRAHEGYVSWEQAPQQVQLMAQEDNLGLQPRLRFERRSQYMQQQAKERAHLLDTTRSHSRLPCG